MRLFISYAHVDYPQVSQIVDILRTGGHDPWFDHRLLPGQDWKATLYHAIQSCNAFVYVMSPEALASEWCLWEFAQAIDLSKPIIPVRLQANISPPDALSRFQWVDFSDGSTPKAVAQLMGGLFHLASPIPKDEAPSVSDNPSGIPAQANSNKGSENKALGEALRSVRKLETLDDINAAIGSFYVAYKAQNWEDALRWLRKLIESGKPLRTFKADEFFAEIEAKLDAERDYASLRVRTQYENPESIWNALLAIWDVHPDYDPDSLRYKYRHHAPRIKKLLDIINNPQSPAPERANAGLKLAELGDPRAGVGLREDGLPDIAWVEIPAGDFIYGNERDTLPAYSIARYPVTHIQFQAFLDDPDGFSNELWWKGLPRQEKEYYDTQWTVANYPRDSVSWLHAMAFCRWLTARLGFRNKILLPTDQEWEKAARGTSGRLFPWGDSYLSGYANINESYQDENHQAVGDYALAQPTAVGIYPMGASAYGVLDMMGNVWEWCLTEFETGYNDRLDANEVRITRGGSWDSVIAHAKLTGYNYAAPGYAGDTLGFRLCVSKAE